METKLLKKSLKFNLRFNQLDEKAIDEHFKAVDRYLKQAQIEILEELMPKISCLAEKRKLEEKLNELKNGKD